ncbi:hypothetical protein ACEPAG_1277 [Sanghuangporus baumii]
MAMARSSWDSKIRPRASNYAVFLGLLFPSIIASSAPADPFSRDLSLDPFLGLQHLSPRAVQSTATCLSQFDWMDNSLEQSPCIVAAYLLAQCAGGNWDIDPIQNASVHYTPPTAGNANGCRCSWAVYNTLQACAFCQGENFDSAMLGWSGYSTNCTGSLLSNDTYYPTDTPIPDETAIPFWATTDPSTWHNALFDPSVAESIANENKPDITESSRDSSNKKGSNTGAIVGGVVGGVLGALALGLLFFFLRRRARLRAGHAQGANLKHRPTFSTFRFSPLSHWRTGSNVTTAADGHQPLNTGGKYAGQTHAGYAYNNLSTSSPGPSLPLSLTGGSGSTSNGRPPYNTMPSSSSFISGPTATATPPLGADYVTHTQPGKNYGYGFPPTLGPGMGMVTMNNPSNPTVSSAYATGAPSAISGSAMARNSHAHTLSDNSAVFSAGSHGMNMGGEHPEGAITPFVLPPVLPEPMGAGADIGRSTTPGLSGKAGHGRGPSDSSQNTNNTTNATDLFTSANAPRRPPPERRNPPAYTPTSPPIPPGIAPGADEAGGDEQDAADGDALSVEAQRAETTLSGTTLRGQTSSGRAATTLAGDADGSQAGPEERERNAHGYPADRKVQPP